MKKRFLFFFLISGLVLMNACQREYSLEGGSTPSVGSLQDDGAGDCLPKTVSGAYVAGTALTTSNYIDVEVNVATTGSYTIYTDTVNGMYFRGSGVFTATGLNTVRLKGFGTPVAIGISNFVVTYGLSGCTIAVTTVGSLATFTLAGSPAACMNAAVAGTYALGVPLNATNNVTINVNVTAVGAYNVVTTLSNGMIFSGSGNFTVTGAQAIVLTGSGTPTATGNSNIPVTAGSSSCNFNVTVGSTPTPATFTVDCTSAVPNGTYTSGTALSASNTVSIGVNVATAGTYTITTTATNGMTFTATGVFATTGAQTITLAGSGTPAAAGTSVIPITAGTAPCNFNVTVVAGAGAATFTVTCTTAVPNGTYTVGTALTASNTVTVSVTVATPGTYTITTTATNGMTFSATGNFAATGAQNVTLAGSGIPTTAGSNSIPVPGATPCNFNVTVNPAAGAATFTVNCATAVPNGTYTVGTALTASNTVTISVTVATIGSYTITTTATNGMTFSATGNFATTGAQNVTLTGTGNPTTSGANIIPVPSGTTPCNFTVTVNPGAGGAAVFIVDCSSASLNGYLTKGVPIAAVNTIDIDVNVTTAGTYTITTTPINGITYTASGTFPGTGFVTVTMTGSGTPVNSGTFTLNVPSGTTPCSFDVDVDPNMGTWTFKVGTTTYSGTIYDAAFDNTILTPPSILFYFSGDDAAGNLFDLVLADLNGTVANGEIYKCAPPITGNAASISYGGINGTTYDADPNTAAFATNTVNVTVTSHNTTTRTIIGTFSGNAILNGGTTLVAITNGAFTVTYP